MIVRILSNGKSFAGAAAYLMHDPEAQTNERVAWTHTLNLANDHVPSAVDEMLWTARNAEILKQEAGVRAGGRATENPVKHLSLNWSPEDNPTREHMIETAEEFLRHMKWQEHQAVLVAHNDRAYSHVHVMLNTVHPETGLRLNDSFEQRRAQAWALEYERSQGRVYCEQRLIDPAQREDAPPRNAWVAFRENEKEFAQAEKILRQHEPIVGDEAKIQKNGEWKILKEIQRDERTQFFAEGKLEFSQLRLSIYREVREEFRERWGDYFTARREGADAEALATTKAELVAEQKCVLDARRDEACQELRQSREGRYGGLLDDQRAARADLRQRQEAGLDNGLFLQQLGEGTSRDDVRHDFREAAEEAAVPDGGGRSNANAERLAEPSDSDTWTATGPHDDSSIGLRVGIGVGSLLDTLFFDLTTLGSAPASPPPRHDRGGPDPFEASAIEAQKQQQRHREQEEADTEWRQKQRPL
jgi:hypothetical protein